MFVTQLNAADVKQLVPGVETEMEIVMVPTRHYHFVSDQDCWISQKGMKAWFVRAGYEKLISGSFGARLTVLGRQAGFACLAEARTE